MTELFFFFFFFKVLIGFYLCLRVNKKLLQP